MLVFSISVVIYKTDLKLIESMLLSINASIKQKYILYLIDNSCSDSYFSKVLNLINLQEFKDMNIQTIKSSRNGGYGFGNNIVIRNKELGRYHIVMNPDVIVFEETFKKIVECFQKHNVDMIGPKIILENKKVFNNTKKNPTFGILSLRVINQYLRSKVLKNFLNSRTYKKNNLDIESFNIEYFSGSFMAFKSKSLLDINGFDERFFLHFEDADITRSILINGKNIYCPSVSVLHKWNRETYKSYKMWLITLLSSFKYFVKWRK